MASKRPPGENVAADSGRGVAVATAMLIALPLLVAAMVAGLLLLGERETSRALDERLESATRVTASQITSVIRAGLETLESADARLGENPAQFRSLFTPAYGDTTQSASGGSSRLVAVFSATGEFLPPADLPLAQNAIGENPDFRALAGGERWRITPLIAQGPSGGRSFAIGRRLERDGAFAGAAVIYVSADILVESWLSVNLGKDSTVGVIRDDGWLVTRFPVPPEASFLGDYELFTEHLQRSPTGTYFALSPVDTVRRRVAYARIEGLPLVVTASMSRNVITSGVWRRAQSTALLTTPILIALVLTCAGMILLLRREQESRRALQGALARNQMLLQEVHHRVKNNLQTVEAMIRLQPGSPRDKEELANRIHAMSAVHQHMYESDQFETLRVDTYIQKLTESLQRGTDSRIRVQTQLDPLVMRAERAMPLGLLINEIVQNAFKHAFPDSRSGTISVSLKPGADGLALLHVRDNGVGGMAAAPRVGMGTRLIRGFAQQLGGEPRISEDGGTVFELRFRID